MAREQRIAESTRFDLFINFFTYMHVFDLFLNFVEFINRILRNESNIYCTVKTDGQKMDFWDTIHTGICERS